MENKKYKNWHDYYSKPVSMPEFVRWMNNRKVYLSAFMKLLQPGNKILEAGCGPGIDSVYLSHFGYRVTGVDNDEKVLALAKFHNEYFRGSAKFILQDIFNLDFKDKEFKACFSQGVLEHYAPPQIKKALIEQLRVADYVLFSIPSINITTRSKSFGDENHWPLNKWLEIIKDFKLIDYGGYGFNRGGRMVEKINRIIFNNLFKKYVVRFFAPEFYFLIMGKNL